MSILRGLNSGLRLLGISTDPDIVCERCSTTNDGRCMCASPYPYRRLDGERNERPVKLTFHKNRDSDEGKITMEVERNICVMDLCKILAVKMEYQTTAYWSLVEYWVDKNAERVLEEHEIMVDVYNDMMKFKRRATVRYVMRQDTSKFDFLTEPTRIRNEGGIICEDPAFFENYHAICYIEKTVDEGMCPVFFSRALMRKSRDWEGVYLLLKDRRLFYTDDHMGEQRLMELGAMHIRQHYYPTGPIDVHDIPGLVLIGELSDLQVYRATKEGASYVETNAFLVRPIATPALRTEPLAAPLVGLPVLPKAVIRFTSLSPNFATTWVALMRLAKYGKQLRENYRAFKNKNDASSREFGRANVPNLQQSPLFRRRGCRDHLGERANLQRSAHDHLVPLDFSRGGFYARSGVSESDSRRDATIFHRYLTRMDQEEAAREGTLSRLTRSIRRRLHIGNEEPTSVLPALPAPEEAQASSSRDTAAAPEPAEDAERTTRFGAIRKIFSPKQKTTSKRKKSDETQIIPGSSSSQRDPDAIIYKDYVSEDRSSQEDTVELSPSPTTSPDKKSDILAVPSMEIGATALSF